MHGRLPRARAGAMYLRYDDPQRTSAGIGHWLTNLKCLALEAARLRRVAILPSLVLSEKHNFGVHRDWRWETYFDLGAAQLVNIVTGRSRAAPITDRAPPCDSSLTLAPREPAPRCARSVQLIVRRVEGYYPPCVPRSLLPNWVRLSVPPSTTVTDLVEPVVRRLLSHPRGYVAIHIRRGDRARLPTYAPWAEATTPDRVRAKLREHGVGRETPVYVMSDERDPAYWAALRECCRMYRYRDFRELSAVVARVGKNAPDNYLLFVAEREIMRHARFRIGTAWGTERPPANDWLVKPPTPGSRRAVHWVRRRLLFGPQSRDADWISGKPPRDEHATAAARQPGA